MKVVSLFRLNYKKYILEFVLTCILFFALFVPNSFPRTVVAGILLAYMFIVTRFCRKSERISINKKQVMIQLLVFAGIYVVGYYILGLYFGYYKNPVRFTFNTILTYIIPISIIIICSEIIRNSFVSEKDIISNILTTIITVLIDVVIYSQIYDMTKLDDFLTVVGLITFASVSCNLLYNYICLRFGYKSIIIYRLITVLYVYIIPILPDVYTFFRATLRIIYPYIIYLFLESIYAKNKGIETQGSRVRRTLNAVIIITVAILLTMLVSCQFYVGILAIGSGSMTGAIDKGDAVVFVQYREQEIKEQDVIVFRKDSVMVVHRVVNIVDNGGRKQYYTKGDINEQRDQGFVTDDDIIGITKFRIRYIGYPSLWLSDIFLAK